MKACRCFGQTVAVLAVFAVARPFGLLGPAVVSVSLLTAALALIAWSAGATRADLGLGRADMRAGLLYGAGAFGVVLLVLVMAAAIRRRTVSSTIRGRRSMAGGCCMSSGCRSCC
jgi:uncharacterized protein